MTIPAASLTVRDGALGIVPEDASSIPAIVGIASSGNTEEVQSFSDIQSLKAHYGQGPLVEAAALVLAVAGGPVRCVRIDGSVAGAVGAVTHTGGGATVTPSGTPNDAYLVVVEIIAGGAVGTATFRYSLDDGETWSEEISTAASYEVPDTGIVLAFDSTAEEFVADETYEFGCTPTGYNSTDLGTALDALLSSELAFGFIFIVGVAADIAGAATLAAAVDTKLTTAASAHRYVFAVMECPFDPETEGIGDVTAGFSGVGSTRVGICADAVLLTSVLSGRGYRRTAAWPVVARLAASDLQVDPGRVIDGALPGITAVARDERKSPGLYDAGFLTVRTWVGRTGYYCTGGVLKTSSSTSDYRRLSNRRVMDRGSTVTYEALVRYINDTVRVDPDTGFIDERDAKAIEAYVTAQLEAALVATGAASSVAATVKRDENILSTSNLTVSIRIVPLGQITSITADIGFENPALAVS